MGVRTWANERSRALTAWDLGFQKVASMLFGMIVGAFVASFVIENVWWFVIAMLVLGGRSGYRWLTARTRPSAGS